MAQSTAPAGSTLDVVNRFNDAINRHDAVQVHDPHRDPGEVIVAGDRCTVRWVYRKMRDGKPWHLRGIDLFTIRDGKVAAKLAYVKG